MMWILAVLGGLLVVIGILYVALIVDLPKDWWDK